MYLTEEFDQVNTEGSASTTELAAVTELKSSLKSSLRYPIDREYTREPGRRDSIRQSGSNDAKKVVIDLGEIVQKETKKNDAKGRMPKRKLFASLKQARVDKDDAYHRAFSSANINLDDDSTHENRMDAWKQNRKQGIRRLSIFHRFEGLFSSDGGFTLKSLFEYFAYTFLAIAIQLSSGLPTASIWPDSYDSNGTHVEATKTCRQGTEHDHPNNEMMCNLAVSHQGIIVGPKREKHDSFIRSSPYFRKGNCSRRRPEISIFGSFYFGWICSQQCEDLEH